MAIKFRILDGHHKKHVRKTTWIVTMYLDLIEKIE